MDVYEASDYAGLVAGDYDFYYGYEKVWCPVHGFTNIYDEQCNDYDEDPCDGKTEWAFEARKNGQVIAQLKQSELGIKDNFECAMNLLAGIGKVFERASERQDG